MKKKTPKPFDPRKLFHLLVVGGALTAVGCGSNPCQSSAVPDGGDAGATTSCPATGPGGGVNGW